MIYSATVKYITHFKAPIPQYETLKNVLQSLQMFFQEILQLTDDAHTPCWY